MNSNSNLVNQSCGSVVDDISIYRGSRCSELQMVRCCWHVNYIILFQCSSSVPVCVVWAHCCWGWLTWLGDSGVYSLSLVWSWKVGGGYCHCYCYCCCWGGNCRLYAAEFFHVQYCPMCEPDWVWGWSLSSGRAMHRFLSFAVKSSNRLHRHKRIAVTLNQRERKAAYISFFLCAWLVFSEVQKRYSKSCISSLLVYWLADAS